ncbi:YheC/YheD family endospore coat-associated protein [Bacillus sp. Marseille-P3661]|uniref:YheC/YheD family endospore coat-associated protein n=1 Tax=Bacillus sp. Marseille-P3661 TaxID=1936234 RepID=UPI000C8646E1|nr:YheC/YheD family protein [Bacillus sp. Marseille-P3661]
MQIKWLDTDDGCIHFHEDALINSNILNDEIVLCIGAFQKSFRLVINNKLKRNEIGLSRFISNQFTIPQNIPYEIQIKNNYVNIGPVIAIIVQEYAGDPNDILKINETRLRQYPFLKGLIYICHSSGIDLKNKRIEGYGYIGRGKVKHQWLKGTFPYPNVVLNRTKKLTTPIFNSLQSIVGNNIMNSGYIDKWTQYQFFSERELTANSLPETRLLKDFADFKHMIDKYGAVYLKPFNLANGKGIIYVQKGDSHYVVRDTENRSKPNQSTKSIRRLLHSFRSKTPYIIQQPVPFAIDNRHIDFRIYMQKDKNMQWSTPGFFAKVSKENSINTNYKNRSRLIEGRKALRTLYKMNIRQTKHIINKLFILCKEACEIAESNGIHIADVAFDVIIDKNHHIWLIELQICYGFEYVSLPKRIYYKQMRTPLEYAKTLAGF